MHGANRMQPFSTIFTIWSTVDCSVDYQLWRASTWTARASRCQHNRVCTAQPEYSYPLLSWHWSNRLLCDLYRNESFKVTGQTGDQNEPVAMLSIVIQAAQNRHPTRPQGGRAPRRSRQLRRGERTTENEVGDCFQQPSFLLGLLGSRPHHARLLLRAESQPLVETRHSGAEPEQFDVLQRRMMQDLLDELCPDAAALIALIDDDIPNGGSKDIVGKNTAKADQPVTVPGGH